MDLVALAAETLALVEQGEYRSPSGRVVDMRADCRAAIEGTVLHRPDELEPLAAREASGLLPAAIALAPGPRIELTTETTAQAGRRLVERELETRVLALNFASARNPGGGFLGARAQEEDLARCSALYPCLVRHADYYAVNRACPTTLYTDHMIHSPEVPFFRDERLRLLEAPFHLSLLTAPAPNAGALHRHPEALSLLPVVFAERARKVLLVAAAHGHRTVILGAWGCGAFRNDPRLVAGLFARLLSLPYFQAAFDRVVFAIHDPGGRNLAAFETHFGMARLL